MSDIKLGELAPDGAQRDAIHVAVAPVVAGSDLHPGQRVRIDKGIAIPSDDESHGIVDPWLPRGVLLGQCFYVLLHQNTVTGMRHHWSHPAFMDARLAAKPAYSPSEQWLRDFAARIPLDYNVLMSGAEDWIEHENYLCFGGLLEGEYVPDEFWTHYEAVTGQKGSGSFFTCSC